jgi:pimeloyl-ACP methyl ester carboxylesterase
MSSISRFNLRQELPMTADRRLVCLVFFAVLSFLFARLAPAQNGTNEELASSLVTRDGVQLKITYFPGAARKGSAEAKQTTPVVLLHDYKGSRAAFASLVQKLEPSERGANRPSFAAITVDLRAHGESIKQALAGGTQVDLDPAKLGKEDYIAMARFDMEAVRNFLVDKNDAGELNLGKLCVIGSGMGASVAANWALVDWSAPPLAVGTQGQDVKAVVLISPRWNYNGLSMQAPMQFRPLKEKVAWMLIYGENDKSVQSDVNRIKNPLKLFHPPTDKTGKPRESGLTVLNLKTKLQGDRILTQVGGTVESEIVKFLIKNVADTEPQWFSRRNRLP